MINSFIFDKKRMIETNGKSLKKISFNKKHAWIVVKNPTKEDIEILHKKFKLHPTTLEDINSPLTRIKYEELENNTLIVFKGIKSIKNISVNLYTLFFIDGEGYVITLYYDNNETIETLLQNKKKIEALLKRGEDYILHYILDREVDKYMDIRTDMSEELKLIEEKFIKSPTRDLLKQLFLKERVVLELKMRADALTDICLMLVKPTDNFIKNSLLPYFRDVYDHISRVSEALKSFIDRINSVRNSYLSLMSNKTNETISILTIIMAVMMPMTIITGFYGMNIKLPMQEHPKTYVFLILLMILIVIIFWVVFRRISKLRRWE